MSLFIFCHICKYIPPKSVLFYIVLKAPNREVSRETIPNPESLGVLLDLHLLFGKFQSKTLGTAMHKLTDWL